MKRLKKELLKTFTAKQKALAKKHGTPNEFAIAVYKAVPEISMTEAEKAIEKYDTEWKKAGNVQK
jgi:hypothetical protein